MPSNVAEKYASKRWCSCLNVEISVIESDDPDDNHREWQSLYKCLSQHTGVDASLFFPGILIALHIKYKWLTSACIIDDDENHYSVYRCWSCNTDLFCTTRDIVGRCLVSHGLQTTKNVELMKKNNTNYVSLFDIVLSNSSNNGKTEFMNIDSQHPSNALFEQLREGEKMEKEQRIQAFIEQEEKDYLNFCNELKEYKSRINHMITFSTKEYTKNLKNDSLPWLTMDVTEDTMDTLCDNIVNIIHFKDSQKTKNGKLKESEAKELDSVARTDEGKLLLNRRLISDLRHIHEINIEYYATSIPMEKKSDKLRELTEKRLQKESIIREEKGNEDTPDNPNDTVSQSVSFDPTTVESNGAPPKRSLLSARLEEIPLMGTEDDEEDEDSNDLASIFDVEDDTMHPMFADSYNNPSLARRDSGSNHSAALPCIPEDSDNIGDSSDASRSRYESMVSNSDFGENGGRTRGVAVMRTRPSRKKKRPPKTGSLTIAPPKQSGLGRSLARSSMNSFVFGASHANQSWKYNSRPHRPTLTKTYQSSITRPQNAAQYVKQKIVQLEPVKSGIGHSLVAHFSKPPSQEIRTCSDESVVSDITPLANVPKGKVPMKQPGSIALTVTAPNGTVPQMHERKEDDTDTDNGNASDTPALRPHTLAERFLVPTNRLASSLPKTGAVSNYAWV